MPDEDLKNRLAAVDVQGKQRFGDDWHTAIAAIHRNNPSGIDEQTMGQILSQPDPANMLFTAGRENLLTEADAGNKDSDHAYSQIRQRERQAHRVYKGRS